MTTQVRGWRVHLSVSPMVHPQLETILVSIPGLKCDSKSNIATHMEIPTHAWGLIEPLLNSYFAQNKHHKVYYSTGWRKPRRRENTVLKAFPPTLDPARVPGLNVHAYECQQPHQIAALARLFSQGATLEEIPTGGGKTFVALAAAAAARSIGWKVLIIAPSSTSQWEAEIEKWLDPTVVGGVTVLQGQLGAEVRAYKGRMQERCVALVSREEAVSRLPKGIRLGKLEPLWAEGSLGWVPASDIAMPQRTRAVELGIVKVVTEVASRPRWAVWDTDTDREVANYPEEYRSTTVDRNGDVWEIGPAEAAKLATERMNRDIRSEAQILIVSAGILTHRRDALRKWAPDLVILDESHDYKAFDRWKAAPATVPGAKPTFYLSGTQSASAWYVTEQVSSVLLLSATPDPDRRRDLWSQYDILDPGSMGSFKDWTRRYCGGRMREVKPGVLVWDSTGEVKRGVPLPIDPAMDTELRRRAGFLHYITPRSVSHAHIPPINRQLVWLKATELSRPGKDPEWKVPPRSKDDKVNRLLDMAAEMKRKPAVSRYVPMVLGGQRGVVLTGSHASCDRLGEDFLKRLGGKEFIVTARYRDHLHTIWDALGWKGYTRLEVGQVVHPLVLSVHGGDADRDHRFDELQKILHHPGPALLIGTVDAWGQGWDGMQFLDFAAILRLPWNQGRVLQAEGRFERFGGLFSVLVEYLLALNTIDERLLRTVLGKAETSLKLFDRDDLERLRHGLSEEAAAEDILSSMLAGLLGGEIKAPDEEDFDVATIVQTAVVRQQQDE